MDLALVLSVKENDWIRLEVPGPGAEPTVILIKHGRRHQPGRGISLVFDCPSHVQVTRLGNLKVPVIPPRRKGSE